MIPIAPSRIGVSTAGLLDRDIVTALKDGRTALFDSVEVSAFEGYHFAGGQVPGFSFDQMDDAAREELWAATAEYAEVAVHAPFKDVVMFAAEESVLEASRVAISHSIEAAGYLGASVVTTHIKPVLTPERMEYRSTITEFYRALGDMAEERGVMIGIETGSPADGEALAELVGEIGHAAVGVTVDVGWCERPEMTGDRAEEIAAYNDVVEATIRACGDRICHFHMHDIVLEPAASHIPCGEGVIDFLRIFQTAYEIGYGGQFILEVFGKEEVVGAREGRHHLVNAIQTLTLELSSAEALLKG